MSSSLIDSELFKDQYSTEEMRKVFSERSQIQSWLDCWVALAKAEAKHGVIPKKAAIEIAEKANAENIDMDYVREGFKKTSHPLMPQIRAFTKLCSPEAGGYIHWGATTQDITDTGMILQLRNAQDIIENQLEHLLKQILSKADQYKFLPEAGRTHAQHAVPITLGYKFAIWADEIGRDINRLKHDRKEYFAGNFGGAAGTLASLFEKGIAVRNDFCKNLNLSIPEITWHVSRDRLANFASDIAIAASTIGKIANEIVNLQRTEIEEVEEGFQMGKVGSSTMPQKRNPMICENIYANVRLVKNDASLGFECMEQEHERDMSFWQTEWKYLSEMCLVFSSAIKMMSQVMDQMIVHEDNIARNLDMTNGLIVSERVMLDLGHYIGRQNAHEVIYEDAQKAFTDNVNFLDVLKQDKRVTKDVDDKTLKEMLDPSKYIGSCVEMVNAVVKKWRK
ncbi:MAG: adenylosuccinate lyase [Lactobacillaceae bacterium]